MAPVWYPSTSSLQNDKVLQVDLVQPLPSSRSAPYPEARGLSWRVTLKPARQVVGILIAHRVSWLLGFLAAHEGNVHAAGILAQSYLLLSVSLMMSVPG